MFLCGWVMGDVECGGFEFWLLSFWDYIIVLMIQKVLLITRPAALITKGTQSAEGEGVLRGWPRFDCAWMPGVAAVK